MSEKVQEDYLLQKDEYRMIKEYMNYAFYTVDNIYKDETLKAITSYYLLR